MQLSADNNCFVCGKDNPCGLKLSFSRQEGKTISEFTPSALHQGYKNITHGGIITALLDEAMIQAALAEGMTPLTAEINVRFVKPLHAGQPAQVEAEIIKRGTRLIEARSKLTAPDTGEVIAEGHAKLLIQ